ncbi:MAG: glutathione S-transferase [Robiginitomaculum sp.]|nr:MAG: glutathione S-transferase [Robiginitomaculum sp.]
MKLVGQYDSPYTRRVAISLHMLGFGFENIRLSVFGDAAKMQQINPLIRIPALTLDDGEVLIDSAAILDWLDETVGTERALMANSGAARRKILRIIAIATGAIDKAMGISYERYRRPPEKMHQPWINRLSEQLNGALSTLEAYPLTPWLMGDRLTQADITVAAMIGYLQLYLPDFLPIDRYSNLALLSCRCEAEPAFMASLPTPEDIGGNIDEARQAITRLQGRVAR